MSRTTSAFRENPQNSRFWENRCRTLHKHTEREQEQSLGCDNKKVNEMDIDMKAMKAELGGAFMLSWVVLTLATMVADPDSGDNVTLMAGAGFELALGGAIALAVAWTAFSGAHLLPVVTWSHMMTGDLGDAEGNWMANGMRLVAQVVGAALAVLLATEASPIEAGTAGAAALADSMNVSNIEIWSVLGMVAAGAVWWQIHTRCDSAWMSAFGLMALGGMMTLTGAHEMGTSRVGGGTEIANVLVNWVTDGLFVGIGAFLGVTVDGMIGEEE